MSPHLAPFRQIARSAALCAALLLATLRPGVAGEIHDDPEFHYPTNLDLGRITWAHLLRDGKILAGGDAVVRLLDDGTLDPDFPILSREGGFENKPVLSRDGAFTVFGNGIPGAPAAPFMVRYTAAGTIDPTFAADLSALSEIHAVHADSSGRYVLTGIQHSASTASLIRLLPSGQVDPSFTSPVGIVPNAVYLDNKRLVVARTLPVFSPLPYEGLVHLQDDGSIAKTLEPIPGSHPITHLLPGSAGRWLAGGSRPLVQGLLRNGALDPQHPRIYGEDQYEPSVGAMLRLKDRRTLVGGSFGTYISYSEAAASEESVPRYGYGLLFRLLPDGAIDHSLLFDGDHVPGGRVRDLVEQPDGKILMADGSTVLRRFVETDTKPLFAFGNPRVTAQESTRFVDVTVYRMGPTDLKSSVVLSSVPDAPATTASAGADYLPTSQRVSFRKGEWKRTIRIRLINDELAEPAEQLSLRLTEPDANSTVLLDPDLVIHIEDDDSAATR